MAVTGSVQVGTGIEHAAPIRGGNDQQWTGRACGLMIPIESKKHNGLSYHKSEHRGSITVYIHQIVHIYKMYRSAKKGKKNKWYSRSRVVKKTHSKIKLINPVFSL